MSILFTATYPELVSSLILGAATARYRRAPDYPCGRGSDEMFDSLEKIAAHRWGQGATIDWFLPSRASSPPARQMFARFERMAVSPSAFLWIVRMVREIDLRAVLPAIHVPTLVIQRLDDIMTPPCHGRYLASQIAGARYFEQPGDHALRFAGSGDIDRLFDEIEDFLTGASNRREPDRVLATILLAEAVDSTEHPDRASDLPQPGRLDAYSAAISQRVRFTAVACPRAPHKASSPPSTRPDRQFSPQPPSAPTPPHTESSYAPGSTRGKWTWPATRSGESLLISSGASPPMRSLRRSSSPGPSRTWSSDPESRSPTAVSTNSEGPWALAALRGHHAAGLTRPGKRASDADRLSRPVPDGILVPHP